MDPIREIDPGLWQGVVDTIDLAASEGLKRHPGVNYDFKQQLLHNDQVFAAFKVHRLQGDMARQMVDAEGNIKSFEQWARDVQPIASHQCRQWLRTEYDTAVKRASLAADWQRFEDEKDVLPNLRWVPSTAANPDAFHQSMWDTVLPVDHPFWSAHHPGDRWGCQCALEATDDPVTPSPTVNYATSPGLENNPGRDAKLFNDTHPYFPDSCDNCPFRNSHNPSGPVNLAKDCYHCQYVDASIPMPSKAIDKAMVKEDYQEWCNQNFGEIILPDGNVSKGIVLDNSGEIVIVNRTFFNETFAKNHKSKKLAETMKLAEAIQSWFPTAQRARIEKGKHHPYEFQVYEATYLGVKIECKAKMLDYQILYTMRIKKED